MGTLWGKTLMKCTTLWISFVFLFLSGSFLVCALHASDSAPITIKFATLAPEGSTWMKHMRGLEKAIQEKSHGQIAFRIYAGGVAGDELDVLRKLRIGQLHCAAFSGVGFGQILPMVRVLDLPFLFRNDRETDLVHEALEGYFSERFREKGFELLAWAEVGNVHFFSKKPIHGVKDLAPLRVWAWAGDPVAKEALSLMGAHPIPLAVTDVTTALNTGMLDTIYAPPLGALALQWHRSLNYMTALPLAHSTGAILLSLKLASEMPPPLFGILKAEFHGAMGALTRELREQSKESIKELEKSGLTVIPMPQGEDLEAFYRIHEQVARNLSGNLYPQEILNRIYDILQRPR